MTDHTDPGPRPYTDEAFESLMKRLRFPGKVERIGHDMRALTRDAGDALRGERARAEQAETQRDAARQDRVCRRETHNQVAAERDALRAELHKLASETAKVLLTVKPQLDRPYPDDQRWSPWTRWVEKKLDPLLKAALAGPGTPGEDAAPAFPDGPSALELACAELDQAFPGVDLGDVSDVLAALPPGILRALADAAEDVSGAPCRHHEDDHSLTGTTCDACGQTVSNPPGEDTDTPAEPACTTCGGLGWTTRRWPPEGGMPGVSQDVPCPEGCRPVGDLPGDTGNQP